MACDEGQEVHLESLAQTLDGYVDQLKGSFGEIGDQRLTVMAGIMITDEMEEAKRKIADLEAEVERLTAKTDATLGAKDGLESELADKLNSAAEKLEKLGIRLKTPIATS